MPKRVPKHTVITARKGEVVTAAAGQPFDFTDEEVEHLTDKHGAGFLGRHMVEVEDVVTRTTAKPKFESNPTPDGEGDDNTGL